MKAASSPTLAGLTLTAFSGFVKATTGILSAAALASGDIPSNAANTSGTAGNLSGPAETSNTRKFLMELSVGGVFQSPVWDYPIQADVTGLKTTDSPVFVTAKFSTLSDGKIPYHIDDSTGLADGPTKTDVDSAVSLKHAAVTVSAPISLSTQALSLINNAVSPATVTAIDVGALANSDTVIPTSKAVTTAIGSGMVYPGAGIPISTGTAWGTSLDLAEQKLLGRITSGIMTGLTATEVRVLLGLAVGDSPTFAAIKLTTGAALNSILTSAADGTASWVNGPTLDHLHLTNDLPVSEGGTGVSTFALNGILYGNAANAIGVTAIGAAGDILIVGASPFVPVWSAGTGTGVPVREGSPTLSGTVNTTTVHATTLLTDHIGEHTGSHTVVFDNTVTLPASTIMLDGGTIGQAAGPLVAFDDINNYLEITGCKVGIGTTEPNNMFGAGGTSVGIKTVIAGTPLASGWPLLSLINDSAYSAGADKTANLSFGALDSSNYFHVSAEILGVSNFTAEQLGTGYIAFRVKTSSVNADNAAAEMMRITSGGKVGIGTESPGYLLTCNGQPGANGYTAWTNYSDIRFKKEVLDIDPKNSLDKIISLRPVNFKYNDKYAEITKLSLEDKEQTGFIAQELLKVFPEMVGYKKLKDKGGIEDNYLDANHTGLDVHLVNAIKELNIRLKKVETTLNLR